MKIYILKSDVTNFCSFIQKLGENESIMGLSRAMKWQPFGEKYSEIELEVRSNDQGKKIMVLISVGRESIFHS